MSWNDWQHIGYTDWQHDVNTRDGIGANELQNVLYLSPNERK
jgi:hypothetical protein